MESGDLICKIYFYDKERKKMKKIIGVVDKNQIFSSQEEIIELKNYGNKTISKNNLEKVIVYDQQIETMMAKNDLKLKDKLKIEE